MTFIPVCLILNHSAQVVELETTMETVQADNKQLTLQVRNQHLVNVVSTRLVYLQFQSPSSPNTNLIPHRSRPSSTVLTS